jgi:endonuclease/exonuclease/phosphatase (EEP) superfamily protein YafD
MRKNSNNVPHADSVVTPEMVRLSALSELSEVTLKSRLETLFSWLARWGVWVYVVAVLSLTFIVQSEGDRWWLATEIMLGPMWFALLPLSVLVPLASVTRPRLLLPLAAAAVLVLFGVTGFCLPWPWHKASQIDRNNSVSVLTCNVEDNTDTCEELWGVVLARKPDIVALQEAGPLELITIKNERWHTVQEGSLAIASRFPIRDVRTWRRGEPSLSCPPIAALYAIIDLPSGSIAVCNVHLISPQEGFAGFNRSSTAGASRSEQLTELNYWRFRESELLTAWIEEQPRVDIVMGDFNMPVQSRIYRRWWRQYDNAFSMVGTGLGYTQWARIHHLAFGARNDHVLFGDHWEPLDCGIGPDLGADHVPLFATVAPRVDRQTMRRGD